MEKKNDKVVTPIVIMAGGLGKRLQPYTNVLPKPLLVYNNQTMLENIIHLFASQGFRKFYLILCYKKELIMTYLDSLALPYDIQYIIETVPLGTVGGLKLLEHELNTDFILCNCDNLGEFDYNELVCQHRHNMSDLTILVKKQIHTIPFGIIDTRSNGSVIRIREKPSDSFYISTGIHIVSPRMFRFIPNNQYMDMPTLINSSTSQMKIRWEDVGDSPWKDMSLFIDC